MQDASMAFEYCSSSAVRIATSSILSSIPKRCEAQTSLIDGTGGYWLRMHAVEQVLNQFLARSSDNQKVILNLGCG